MGYQMVGEIINDSHRFSLEERRIAAKNAVVLLYMMIDLDCKRLIEENNLAAIYTAIVQRNAAIDGLLNLPLGIHGRA